MIALPDGSTKSVAELATELAMISPGKKLVYATDFADTPGNRQRVIEFARHAHTFFCEATFLQADVERAQRTGHITSRACGEIAAAAGVARLVPFHLSRRYSDNPQALYDEIQEVCDRVMLPASMPVVANGNNNGNNQACPV